MWEILQSCCGDLISDFVELVSSCGAGVGVLSEFEGWGGDGIKVCIRLRGVDMRCGELVFV